MMMTRAKITNVLTLAVVVMACFAFTASSANAAEVEWLGSDATTGEAWRSTSVAKPAAFDPNEDNAYGNDGYHMATGRGIHAGDGPVVKQLKPDYLSSLMTGTDALEYADVAYPQLDDPTLPISSTVANTHLGQLYSPVAGDNLQMLSFTLARSVEFVLTIVVDLTNSTPSALRLNQTVGGAATASAIIPTYDGVVRPGYLFFRVKGTNGDAFVIEMDASAVNRSICGAAFEEIPPLAGTVFILQ